MSDTHTTTWRRYTYGSKPEMVPLADYSGNYDAGAVRAAGFDPKDDEITLCQLAADWNGHPAGARVITECTCEGHSFAVEIKKSEGGN